MRSKNNGMDSHTKSTETAYFLQPGKECTEACIGRAVARARERGITTYVIATTSGYSALELYKRIDPALERIVAVSHHVGFKERGVDRMTPEQREALEARGIPVLTTSHALSGVGRGISNKFGYLTPPELMAQTLRLFGQGTKVACEITVMAADAGLIPMDREVMAIGGTGSGSDTAWIVYPAHSNAVFEFKYRELVCKPE